MTQAQPIDSTAARQPRYEQLLADRIVYGRLYADHLSHLREVTPQALKVFSRLLYLDGALARFKRYDADFWSRVFPAEEARMHFPPATPSDHPTAPCSLCLALALQLDLDVVLPPSARRAA